MHQILLYGLQRSGTNYLEALLTHNFEVQVLIDHYAYSLPVHKHFRPYSKPWFFPHLNLLHDLQYDSFQEFDAHCQRLSGQSKLQYLVLSKDPYSWYVSFNRYARRDKLFYHLKKKHVNHLYMIDYSLYFQKWLSFREERPDKIMLIQYESLLANFKHGLEEIRTHFGFQQKQSIYQNQDKVNMSKAFNKKKREAFLAMEFYRQFRDEELLVLTESLNKEVVASLGYKLHYPGGIQAP